MNEVPLCFIYSRRASSVMPRDSLQGLLANKDTHRPFCARVLVGFALLQDPKAGRVLNFEPLQAQF